MSASSLRGVWLFILFGAAHGIRDITSEGIIDDAGGSGVGGHRTKIVAGGGTSCQYVPRLGRPDDSKWKLMHRDSLPSGSDELVSFRECKARCDADPECVAFARRATTDVAHLAGAVAAAKAARKDQMKLLQPPADNDLSECWLIDRAKSSKVVETIEQAEDVVLSTPFTRLKLETKGYTETTQKVLFEKRNCGCEYRYLGFTPSDGNSADISNPSEAFMSECAGEYRHVAKEFPEYGVESIYMRVDGEKFLYLCPVPELGGKRYWHCFDKQETEDVREEFGYRTRGTKRALSSYLRGDLKFQRCFGHPLEPAPVVDMSLWDADQSGRTQAAVMTVNGLAKRELSKEKHLTRFTCCCRVIGMMSNKCKGVGHDGLPAMQTKHNKKTLCCKRVFGQQCAKASAYDKAYDDQAFCTAPEGSLLESAANVSKSQEVAQGNPSLYMQCAQDKGESSKKKEDFMMHVSSCRLDVEADDILKTFEGLNTWSLRNLVFKPLLSVTLMTGWKGNAVDRVFQLGGFVLRATLLAKYVQDGVDEDGEDLTEGEKYACASKMIEHIKAGGGILPKVAQTLALKPDVVKDPIIRKALKTTQQDNPAKDLDVVEAFIQKKEEEGEAAAPRQPNDPRLASVLGVVNLKRTLATGSVGQVLLAEVKPELSVYERARFGCGPGQQKCNVVVKAVFDDNEKLYGDDWKVLEFLGDSLLPKLMDMFAKKSWIIGKAAAWNGKPLSAEQWTDGHHGLSAGFDTWKAVQQALGSILDEFDLEIEGRNSEKGKQLIESFDADEVLKTHLGIAHVKFTVPNVIRTMTRYVMIQSLAEGESLTTYHASIQGQAKELKEWRTTIFPSIMALYGQLILKDGFFQGDPHPGNWFWKPAARGIGGILTLIDWGLSDDFSAGFGRAGIVYRDSDGKLPKNDDGKQVDQAEVDRIIAKNRCTVRQFYKRMVLYRERYLVCNGYEVTHNKKFKQGELFVPAGASMILQGTNIYFETKFRERKVSVKEFISRTTSGAFAFDKKPDFGAEEGLQSPMVIQRRKDESCKEEKIKGDTGKVSVISKCGNGWEVVGQDATPRSQQLFSEIAKCDDEECLRFFADDPSVDCNRCQAEDPTPSCYESCIRSSMVPPARIGPLTIRPAAAHPELEPLCASLPEKDDAYAEASMKLGYKTDHNMASILALFSELHNTDALALKARQQHITDVRAKESGVKLPDYEAVFLRCMQVFLGMIQDMTEMNSPPFVPMQVTEFLLDTTPDEPFSLWGEFVSDVNEKEEC